MPVGQLSLLSLSNLANAAPTLENCQMTPFIRPSSHIDCKMFCDRIIDIHLTRPSEVLGSAWWMPVEQLSLLSLSNLANAAPTLENCQMSPFIRPSNHIDCKIFCNWIIVMHLTRPSEVLGSVWWMPVEQLSLLSLSNLANAAPTLENCQMSPFVSPSNHIHCKLLCDRIIVMHLTSPSEVLGSAWWMPVEQLSLLSLSNLANAAPTLENCQMSPFVSPNNHIHCKLLCDRIIVMHLTSPSEVLGSAWWIPVEQLSLLSLSNLANAGPTLENRGINTKMTNLSSPLEMRERCSTSYYWPYQGGSDGVRHSLSIDQSHGVVGIRTILLLVQQNWG